MDVTLRASTARDIDWLVELRAEVLRDDLERLGRYDPVRVRRRMRDGFRPASTPIVIMDGRDAGSITVRVERPRWIKHFYLPPDVQGRDGGTRMRPGGPGEQRRTGLVINLSSIAVTRERYSIIAGSPHRSKIKASALGLSRSTTRSVGTA